MMAYENLTNSTMATNMTAEDGVLRPEALLVPIIFVLIFIVGLAGNVAVIYLVAKQRVLQSVPYILIVNLAAGDLLFIVICVPFTSTLFTLTDWPYGRAVCKMNEFLQTLATGVSVFTLAALSVERYRVIVTPFQYKAKDAKQKTLAAVLLIWVGAILLAIPEVVGSHINTIYTPSGRALRFCDPFPAEWGAWYPKFQSVTRFIVLFLAPVLVAAVCYARLARFLCIWQDTGSDVIQIETKPDCKQDLVNGNTTVTLVSSPAAAAAHSQCVRRRHTVAKVVMALVCLFVVCWLPRHIYLLWFHHDVGNFNLFWYVFKILGFCLSFMNSALNPFVLYFLDKAFQQAARQCVVCSQKTQHVKGETLVTDCKTKEYEMATAEEFAENPV